MGQVVPMPNCTFTRQPIENPALPHQLVMRFEGGTMHTYASCNCLRTTGGGYAHLATGNPLPVAAARGAWLEHMATIWSDDERDPGDDQGTQAAQLPRH